MELAGGRSALRRSFLQIAGHTVRHPDSGWGRGVVQPHGNQHRQTAVSFRTGSIELAAGSRKVAGLTDTPHTRDLFVRQCGDLLIAVTIIGIAQAQLAPIVAALHIDLAVFDIVPSQFPGVRQRFHRQAAVVCVHILRARFQDGHKSLQLIHILKDQLRLRVGSVTIKLARHIKISGLRQEARSIAIPIDVFDPVSDGHHAPVGSVSFCITDAQSTPINRIMVSIIAKSPSRTVLCQCKGIIIIIANQPSDSGKPLCQY